jgi:catechol 2,3-dioxygenase-like lactoylglutathione lyase family enzyme
MATEFDHIAFAADDMQPFAELLSAKLGATMLFGQACPGFRWALARVGDGSRGMNVELLEPWRVSESGFLSRFLERRGAGPHHLTFKTHDITDALARVREAGYNPIDVSLDDPGWREAFISPRQAHGTIVQLGESNVDRPPMAELIAVAREAGSAELLKYARGNGEADAWWAPPSGRAEQSVALERVVIATEDLAAGLRLFAGALDGVVIDVGETWVELDWPGAASVRLERSENGAQGIVRIEGGPDIADAPASLGGVPLVLR